MMKQFNNATDPSGRNESEQRTAEVMRSMFFLTKSLTPNRPRRDELQQLISLDTLILRDIGLDRPRAIAISQ